MLVATRQGVQGKAAPSPEPARSRCSPPEPTRPRRDSPGLWKLLLVIPALGVGPACPSRAQPPFFPPERGRPGLRAPFPADAHEAASRLTADAVTDAHPMQTCSMPYAERSPSRSNGFLHDNSEAHALTLDPVLGEWRMGPADSRPGPEAAQPRLCAASATGSPHVGLGAHWWNRS